MAGTTARPVVLADILVSRAGAEPALHALLDTGDLDYASLLWGRRVIDESGPGFLGTYIGAASDPTVRTAIEDAACLVTAGVHFTDLISGFFSQRLDPATRIDVAAHQAVVAGQVFDGVEMADALGVLTGLVTRGPADRDTALRDGAATNRSPDHRTVDAGSALGPGRGRSATRRPGPRRPRHVVLRHGRPPPPA